MKRFPSIIQVGNAKAASFPNGNFMAISGSEWKRDDQGRVVLDKNGKKFYQLEKSY